MTDRVLLAFALVLRRILDDLHGVTKRRYRFALAGHALHALGVAFALTISTCGLNSLTGSTFEQAPRQRENKRGPACRSESQRARIVHRARPAIETWTTLFDHKIRSLP